MKRPENPEEFRLISFEEQDRVREAYASGLVVDEPLLSEVRRATSTATWLKLQRRRQCNILYSAHPRIRVKAWTKRITMEEHFALGSQWTANDLASIHKTTRESVVRNRPQYAPVPHDWMK